MKPTDIAPFSSRSLFSSIPLLLLLCLAVAAYIFVFSAFSVLSFRNFSMSAYDVGIHAQAIWKLATGNGLFNTVRGLPIWGDHCWFIMLLYAPLYRIFPHVETLLILQSAALGLATFPLASIILRRGGGRLAALLFCLAWLLSPALQNMNLENYHPEVLAAPFLLWAVERGDAGKWRGYWLAVGVALLCKEDVALTVSMIGCWIFWKNKRTGIVTILLSVVWFGLCMKVFLPMFNNEGFFRFQSGYWFSRFWGHRFDPAFYLETLARARVGIYAWKLGMPLLFLFLLNPLLAAAAIPSFLVNVLSGNDYLISIDYHYNFQTLPMLFGAAALSYCWLRRKTGSIMTGRLLAAGVLVASLWANISWSSLPVQKVYHSISSRYRFYTTSGVRERFERFAALLPADPGVPIAVSHNILPNLCQRARIYMFPNPFRAQYWGIRGENLPDPDSVEMLFLDKTAIGPENLALFKRLVENGDFNILREEGSLVLAERAQEDAVKPLADPLKLAPPADSIRLLAYPSRDEVQSLTPLWGRVPDIDITTGIMKIPHTAGRLTTAEGLDLGGSDNLRLFLLGGWSAEGREPIVFRLQADDGCRLYVDSKLVIDYEGVHAFGQTISSAPLQLSPGSHTFAVDYFEWGGEAGLLVEWAGADSTYRPLTAGQALP